MQFCIKYNLMMEVIYFTFTIIVLVKRFTIEMPIERHSFNSDCDSPINWPNFSKFIWEKLYEIYEMRTQWNKAKKFHFNSFHEEV